MIHTSIQKIYKSHMDIYVKDIQQMEYQLPSKTLVLNKSYQKHFIQSNT